MRFSNNSTLDKFKRISIEPCNICQLKCIYCPTGIGLQLKDTPKGMLTLDTVEKICSTSLKGYKGQIALYNWGEPFLNPDLPGIIKHLKNETKAQLIINSNFSFQNDIRLKEVLKYLDKDIVIISCDGFSQEICEKYRKNVDFKKIMHNIDLLIQNRHSITLIWQYLEFPWSLEEIEKARKYCKTRKISFYTQIGGNTCNYPMLPIPSTKNPNKFRCDFLFDNLVINYDGEVYPCCAYYGPKKYSLGNASTTSIETIFTKGKGKMMLDYLSYKMPGNEEIFCTFCVERNSIVLGSWVKKSGIHMSEFSINSLRSVGNEMILSVTVTNPMAIEFKGKIFSNIWDKEKGYPLQPKVCSVSAGCNEILTFTYTPINKGMHKFDFFIVSDIIIENKQNYCGFDCVDYVAALGCMVD